jgi:hypothetical protein
MTIKESRLSDCGGDATGSEKPCQGLFPSLCRFCFAFGSIPLAVGLSRLIQEFCRRDGLVSRGGGGQSKPAGHCPRFRAPPSLGFCASKIGKRLGGRNARRARTGAGQRRAMRPSIGDEDRLRRRIWCAMPELRMQGRLIAQRSARCGFDLRGLGSSSGVIGTHLLTLQNPFRDLSNTATARPFPSRPRRALEAALACPKRVQHAQQDDYRRLPPGRDPGGRATG